MNNNLSRNNTGGKAAAHKIAGTIVFKEDKK
jgi:hypothetical protein